MTTAWQDVLIMLGGFVFSVALLPSVFSHEKPKKVTCVTTAAVLWAYCVAFASLNLWLSTLSTALTALCWSILFFQKRAREAKP